MRTTSWEALRHQTKCHACALYANFHTHTHTPCAATMSNIICPRTTNRVYVVVSRTHRNPLDEDSNPVTDQRPRERTSRERGSRGRRGRAEKPHLANRGSSRAKRGQTPRLRDGVLGVLQLLGARSSASERWHKPQGGPMPLFAGMSLGSDLPQAHHRTSCCTLLWLGFEQLLDFEKGRFELGFGQHPFALRRKL